jgi:hypothetical protein
MHRIRKEYPAKRKLYTRWYEDGAAEIGTGILLLLLGLYYTAVDHLQGHPVPQSVTALLIPVLIITWRIFLGKSIKKFKQRVTARRTGYVTFRKPNTKERVIRGSAAGILFGILFGLTAAFASTEWIIPAAASAGMFALYLMLYIRLGVFRFLLVGLTAPLGALFGILMDWNISQSLASVLFLNGGTLTAAGSAVLYRYLKNNPEENDG